MTRKSYILGVLTALCLLGTGYYTWTLYNAHRKQMAEWNEGAKAAFEEALWMEVNKRAEEPIYIVYNEEGVRTLGTKIPDTVYVTSAFGRKGYRIERYKYDNSLVKETVKRGDLGSLLEVHPLSIDTLYINWNHLLSFKQLPVRGQLRYVYTDLNLNNDTVYSNPDRKSPLPDSLTTRYLGFRCEHEISAYISYPHWLSSFSWWDGFVNFVPWLLLTLLYIFYPHWEAFVHRKFVREKVVEKTIEVEKRVVVEKKVHLTNVKMEKAQTFEFPDGTKFDAFSCTLNKDGLQQRLQPQSVSLLKLFLREKNHQVTSDEICIKLWGDVVHTDRLYSAVRRLRNDLKKVQSELSIESTYGVYELKSPISSKETDQT